MRERPPTSGALRPQECVPPKRPAYGRPWLIPALLYWLNRTRKEALIINITIREGLRGLKTIDGVVTEWLRPGKHRWISLFRQIAVQLIDGSDAISRLAPGVERVLPTDEAIPLDVPADHAALITRDGAPACVVEAGRWVLWQFAAVVQAQVVDLRPLRTTIPTAFWDLADRTVQEVVVRPFERALVFADGALAEVLEEGRHGLNRHNRALEVVRLDLREQELQVTGQELITKDKVTLRLNLLVKHRIVDPVAAATEVTVLRDALWAEVQLVARNTVAGVTVDELLERRAELARDMVAAVDERAKAWGVTVRRLDIKDVVLPGDMKTLLNQVIEAEKRAAAQNILRREETAATRSQANTARLLEANPVLLRLKEVEAWKEIAEKIPNLTVVVAPKDVQDRLRLG